MKKNRLPTISEISRILFITVLTLAFACKKSDDNTPAAPKDSFFTFTFKGNSYSLPLKQGTAEWAVYNNTIYINRPDLFNGIIYFPKISCAYLEPSGSSVQTNDNCQLTQNGLPIDSSAVYIFKSGSKQINYKNCVTKSELDPISGNLIPYEVCDVDGTFFLTLENREHQTIEIIGGSFKVYGLRK